jgi:LysR family glycine cleavage system transcriptional activator
MNKISRRPLGLSNLRAFEAVARRLSFSAAAEETFVTQSAISRQIKGLEDELGAPLFVRGTRRVELTTDGAALLRIVEPWLARLDAGVRQIRSRRTRARVSVSTFASFASLWLLPRLEAFQREHPDIDIRVSAQDGFSDPDDPELDLLLRYCLPPQAPAGAVPLFGEVVSPAVSRTYAARCASGELPPLARVADLAAHTLADEDDHHGSAAYLNWRHWLAQHGEPTLQARRWLELNFTYQQVQAGLAGQCVILARIALVGDALARGELVEPFGAAGRIRSPYGYWLGVTAAGAGRAEVAAFARWVREQAVLTRASLGETAEESTGPGEGD